uniref:BCL10 immune signaling adaptor n=1 Tax=Tetraodon nigroviridis TaxID=99883 RepID=H3C748_TETNG
NEALPPALSATDDEMAEVKKDVLTRLRHYLCDKIRAERHLDFLRSRRILTRDDAEEIGCRTTQTKRTAMLLDILAENPRGLDALTDSIREMRSQNFIITKITDEVQKAKNEKIESLKGVSTISIFFPPPAAASSSSSSTSVSSLCTSSHPSTTFSHDSTLLYHPDGEQSPSCSELAGALSVQSLQKSSASAAGAVSVHLLPRPGDPGAPPLPDELAEQAPSNLDAGSTGCASPGGDPNFQPLRSRSLTPT